MPRFKNYGILLCLFVKYTATAEHRKCFSQQDFTKLYEYVAKFECIAFLIMKM